MVEINGKQLCENCFEEGKGKVCKHCGYNAAERNIDPTMLAPGSVLLGKYIVGKVMGKGGFGITYLAYDVTMARKVAIKEFFPYGVALRAADTATVSVSSMKDADVFRVGAEKFYNEARLVSKFNGNPNIVGVYEFFYENDTVYFTMEYLKGHTLKDHVQQHGLLSAAQALFIAQNISNALMVAHSSSVMHRDISPDNIIICDNGDVKLIDFGAARQVVAERSQTFSVILKPGFAPLEQYQKKGHQGPWTDIYSLGATIYYSLTGEIPEDPMSRLEDDEEYSSNKHNIDPELWNIISKATELRIENRYGDVFQLKNDLAMITYEATPLVAQKNDEQIPEFRTAMPYGMSQTETMQTQSVKQPVGVGAAVQPVTYNQPLQPAAYDQPIQPAVYDQPTQKMVSEQPMQPEPNNTVKSRKPKIIAICGAVAVAVAAAFIIPISLNSFENNAGNSNYYSTTTSNNDNTPTENVTNETYTTSGGSTVTYTGEWKNGMPDGQGKGTFVSGNVYEGEWKDGERNGQGKYTWTNGDVYVGEWKDGQRSGQGIMTFAGGDVYDGEWENNRYSGQGTFTWENNDVYEGWWENGKHSGQGKLAYSNGDVYVGLWENGKYSGQGKFFYAGGDIDEGEWKNGRLNGQGKSVFANGDVYEGEFNDGMRYGQGKYTYSDGSVYEGEWKYNYRHGQGKLTVPGGYVWEGVWEYDEFIG